MEDNEFKRFRHPDPTLNYKRLKMLERILHIVDEGFENSSDFNLTEVRIDLKTLLEDVETEMINRGMGLKK